MQTWLGKRGFPLRMDFIPGNSGVDDRDPVFIRVLDGIPWMKL